MHIFKFTISIIVPTCHYCFVVWSEIISYGLFYHCDMNVDLDDNYDQHFHVNKQIYVYNNLKIQVEVGLGK
jgi:hypothetical protein